MRAMAWVCAALLAACGGEVAVDGGARDAGARDDAGARADAGPDGGALGDAGASPDGGASCAPVPGPMSLTGGCDELDLALLDDGTGAVTAQVRGRLFPRAGGEWGCAHVDAVEVVDGDVVLATLTGAGRFAPTETDELLARGASSAALDAFCGDESARFDRLGLVVRGRVDGGVFEARCGAAESGSSWPPRLRLTCHENVDDAPRAGGASVMQGAGTPRTSAWFASPHGGVGLGTASPTVHVIPAAAEAFGALPAPAPFDATFDVTLSEQTSPHLGRHTSVDLNVLGDPFGELCTAGSDPGGPPAPVMLLRVTGTSSRGAYATEAYVSLCTRGAF